MRQTCRSLRQGIEQPALLRLAVPNALMVLGCSDSTLGSCYILACRMEQCGALSEAWLRGGLNVRTVHLGHQVSSVHALTGSGEAVKFLDMTVQSGSGSQRVRCLLGT